MGYRYIPQFELAARHLGVNHCCSLSHLTRKLNWDYIVWGNCLVGTGSTLVETTLKCDT